MKDYELALNVSVSMPRREYSSLEFTYPSKGFYKDYISFKILSLKNRMKTNVCFKEITCNFNIEYSLTSCIINSDNK